MRALLNGAMAVFACVLMPPPGSTAAQVEGSQYAVVVLRPALSYESMQNETALAPAPYGGDAVAVDLQAGATRAAQAKGLTLASLSSLGPEADVNGLLDELSGVSATLLRRQISEEARRALGQLAERDERAAVLVTVARVKVGPGGSWNAYSGAITSSMSQTRLQAALLECRSGRVLWRNETLLREIPRVGDKEYVKALGVLFGTLALPKE